MENDPPRSRTNDQQQLNLSVLRFTFGIPGLDESYLPRWIGYGFGSLLLVNHFLGSGPTSEAQLRSEALGLSLAAFSVAIPYIGKFLKGAAMAEQRTLPEEGSQIFIISSKIPDTLKEDLAWATYVLLRNTSTIAVLISVQGSASWEILPDGTRSLLVQPFVQSMNESQKMEGFLMVASTTEYAYSDKDRAWIQAIANKFRGSYVV